MNTELKQGDKVRTIYGKIEEVLEVIGCQVITYESVIGNDRYHITKVFKCE
jgi:hypothetical protein